MKCQLTADFFFQIQPFDSVLVTCGSERVNPFTPTSDQDRVKGLNLKKKISSQLTFHN